MKNFLIGFAVLSIAALTLGLAGYVYAQDQTPPNPDYPYGRSLMDDYDYGLMGSGYGMMGAYTEGQTPSTDYQYGPDMMEGYDGYGKMSYGQGMMGYGMMGWDGEEGPMHEAMTAALAEALDLSAEELEARHDAGETLWDIAEAEGLNAEEIQELMFNTHDVALGDAVEEGWLTPEQADWMNEHMENMWDGDYGHCAGGEGPGSGSRWHGMSW